MKKSYFILAGILAVVLLGAGIRAHAADPDIMYVRHIEGSVGLSEAGSAQSMDAVVNTPLIEGDTIATGLSGKAELFLKDGSLVRIGKDSVMRVIAVASDGVQFKLEHGSAYIISQGSREVPLFLDTPFTALDITSPSTVRVDAYTNGVDEISVLKGSIFATRQDSGRMLVGEGQRLVAKADGSVPVMARLRAPDDWTRWNVSRDAGTMANTGTSESYAYLPEELRTYSSDLDTNGQWIYTPEYDHVWVPTIVIAGTWSPYRYGRWAWIRGSYVWIGYEPWGWAPYHYGRWIHHRQAGWCWVPPRHRDVRWEPAQVAWVHSSRNVSWVPLGPGEHYDRRSAPVINQVNVYKNTYNNVTIERSAALAGTRYKNASVVNSMVTVDRDRMLRQRMTAVSAPKPGPAMLRKVNLPASVTPARTSGNATGRPLTDRKAPVAVHTPNAPSAMPAKDIKAGGSSARAPAPPQTQPSVAARPLSGTSLNSRIENARISGGRPSVDSSRPQPSERPVISGRSINEPYKDAKGSDDAKRGAQRVNNAEIQPPQAKERVPEVKRAPVPQSARAAVPLHERIQSNPPSPAVKAEPKPAAPQLAGPARSPVKETNPVLRPSTATPAPAANQAARPAAIEGRRSPVVSAAPPPARMPQEARQSQPRGETARGQAVQAADRSRPALPKPAVQSSQPRDPVPRAAPSAKAAEAPGQAKKDAHPAPDKDKPHT